MMMIECFYVYILLFNEQFIFLWDFVFFFLNTYGFSLYSVYPLSFCNKNGEYFLFLDWECISKPVKCFLSHNGQRESLLVFYVGYILDDKNTLCNGCKLTGWSVLIQSLHVIWIVFISNHVIDHKFLEDVHEDSLKIPRQKIGSYAIVRTSLWRRPDASQCLKASALKTSGHQGNTVQTLGQASAISTRSWISVDTVRVSFCKDVRTTWQHVRTLSSISKYSGLLFERGKEL
jgi:hypothetical protein